VGGFPICKNHYFIHNPNEKGKVQIEKCKIRISEIFIFNFDICNFHYFSSLR